MPKDVVCGMNAGRNIESEYNGKQYFFCSSNCKAQFDKNPGKFVK